MVEPELELPGRTRLPAEIAFLRESHPRPAWRPHANFGEMADFWLGVHESLRDHGGQIAAATEAFRDGRTDAAGFQHYFAPHLSHFLQHLDGHHRIEDIAYFPKFRALDPRLGRGIDLLEHDHALIHRQLVAVVGRARELMSMLAAGEQAGRAAAEPFLGEFRTLREWLGRHLADEEELVIPAMLEHTERAVTP